MNRLRTAMFCVFLLSLGACGTTTIRGFAIATNYGVEPQADLSDPNIYTISVYYNEYASAYDIEQNLNRQVSDLMEKQSYSNYDIIGREFGPGGGKCTFRVPFFSPFRSEYTNTRVRIQYTPASWE